MKYKDAPELQLNELYFGHMKEVRRKEYWKVE
jgi:hypothetical protein